MGRPRKTEAQRRTELFGKLYRIGKASIGFTEEDVSRAIGLSTVSLRKRRHNPDTFTLGEMVTLGNLFGWTGEDFASIYNPEK